MSGSDAGSMRSRAVRDGDFYVLNSRKSWVTSGPVADFVLTFMMTEPEQEAQGHHRLPDRYTQCSRFQPRQEGTQAGHPRFGHQRAALRGLPRTARSARLGEEGDGFKIAMTVLDAGRIGIASQALGIAEAAYEASVAYAREREAFGKKIGEFQGIGFKIADMKTRIEASRLLIYQAAMAKEQAKTTGAAIHAEVLDGQAVRLGDGHVLRAHCRPDPRRHGLQPGAAGGAVFPGRQDHRDLRGHQRDPAPGDLRVELGTE